VGGVAQVGDHLVDGVLQRQHLALGLDVDGPGQIALGPLAVGTFLLTILNYSYRATARVFTICIRCR
jgi:hypothetical protein